MPQKYRGVAQFGRAPRSGRGGRRFKSCHLDHGVASFVSLAALFSCFAFKIAASLAPLLRHRPPRFARQAGGSLPLRPPLCKPPRKLGGLKFSRSRSKIGGTPDEGSPASQQPTGLIAPSPSCVSLTLFKRARLFACSFFGCFATAVATKGRCPLETCKPFAKGLT